MVLLCRGFTESFVCNCSPASHPALGQPANLASASRRNGLTHIFAISFCLVWKRDGYLSVFIWCIAELAPVCLSTAQ